MESTSHQWDTRFDRVVAWLLWVTLAIGVFTVFLRDGAVTASYAATGISAVYVLISVALPAHVARRLVVGEALVVSGSVLTMIAVAITGHVNSPFLLLGLLPVLFAGVRGGFRAGIGAAALSSGILASIVIPLESAPIFDLVRWAALLFLVAMTFGYARRLLIEEGNRSAALAAASADSVARLERLETAHRLLTRLAASAESAELNPIEVGTAALDSIRGVVPFGVASISLSSESGLITVARAGDSAVDLYQSVVPMEAGGRQVGALTIATRREMTGSQRDSIEAVLQPAALAFSNVLLLQGIARTAIREERARLARELHDDIGPSLASLGLALDLASLRYPTEPALGAHLKDLRNAVGDVVEDVRSAVSDLRTQAQTPSVTDVVSDLVLARPDAKPSVLFEIDERLPARPSIAPDINAIVVETIRNAINHAKASTITIRGFVNFDEGTIEIHDDGEGFDPDNAEMPGFGLVGMRERARNSNVSLQIRSTDKGTLVSIEWGGE